MAKNYGIGYCEKVLSDLDTLEQTMFNEKGHGFVYMGQEHRTQIEYKRLLAKFKREKENGFRPSYDPSIHGGSA